MSNNDKLFEVAETLLREKSFNELTPDEQVAMLELFGSSEDYEVMHINTLLFSEEVKSDMHAVSPPPAVKQRLLNTMTAMPGRRRVSQGSLIGWLLPLLSLQSLGVKSGVAALVVTGALWFNKYSGSEDGYPQLDTSGQYADTSLNAWDSSSVHLNSFMD